MLAEGLVALLLANSDVAAILATRQTPPDGNVEGNGIFPNTIPEGVPLPAICYSTIHGANEMTLDGPDPFTIERVSFEYRGKYSDVKGLAAAARTALENFQGTLSDGSQVDSMHRVSTVDMFEVAPFFHRTIEDFEIAYRDVGDQD